jgi:hypothetical protein
MNSCWAKEPFCYAAKFGRKIKVERLCDDGDGRIKVAGMYQLHSHQHSSRLISTSILICLSNSVHAQQFSSSFRDPRYILPTCLAPFTLLYITLRFSPPTGVYGFHKRTATKTLESSFTPRETQGMVSRLPSNGTTTLVLPVVVISSYPWPKLLISMWLMSRGMEGEARIRQPMTISSKLRSAFPHQVEACDRPLVRFVAHRIVRSCSLTCTDFHNNRDQDRGLIFKTVRHGSELW